MFVKASKASYLYTPHEYGNGILGCLAFGSFSIYVHLILRMFKARQRTAVISAISVAMTIGASQQRAIIPWKSLPFTC